MHTKDKPTTPLRAVGYCRRSQQQETTYGLDAQEDAIRRWADYNRAQLVAVEPDDDVCGALDPEQRPGFARALERLRAGEADVLVVAKFDRLARSIIGFGDVLRMMRDDDLQLVVLEPELDLRRAHGRAMASMLIGFADIEREAFSDRMQAGRKAKMRRGGYGGGSRLARRYGYQLAPGEDGKLEYLPVEAEQGVIQRISDLRKGGATLAAIRRALEAAGVAPPAGSRWHEPTIKRIAERAAVAA
jgi:DNA invertase Pin-like site-specific DNA recombinase